MFPTENLERVLQIWQRELRFRPMRRGPLTLTRARADATGKICAASYLLGDIASTVKARAGTRAVGADAVCQLLLGARGVADDRAARGVRPLPGGEELPALPRLAGQELLRRKGEAPARGAARARRGCETRKILKPNHK
eukprot:1182814-Prorocentrum_minimum.AAC.2